MGIVIMLVRQKELVRGARKYWRYEGGMLRQARYHPSVSEAVNPLPVTQHCGLPAAVKAGVGGSAAAHHAGASVVTMMASN